MTTKKLLVLLLISFVVTGIIVYELRTRRAPVQTPVGMPAPGSASIPSSDVPALPKAPAPVPQPEPAAARAKIPPSGWGRNPFATQEEIDRAKAPAQIAEAPVEAPRPVEPPSLPSYNVAGIISGDQGNWAIVDARVVHPGDRLGSETVKEIRQNGIVLEHDGKTREVPLRRLEETSAAAGPKKETKP